MSRKLSQCSWSPSEDSKLMSIVKRIGTKSWADVGSRMRPRSGKQCRERWHNHLNPDINKGEWTAYEDEVVIQVHQEIGSRWADIARQLDGRTDNAIKNRWNSTMRRANRAVKAAARGSCEPEETSIYKKYGSHPLFGYCVAIAKGDADNYVVKATSRVPATSVTTTTAPTTRRSVSSQTRTSSSTTLPIGSNFMPSPEYYLEGCARSMFNAPVEELVHANIGDGKQYLFPADADVEAETQGYFPSAETTAMAWMDLLPSGSLAHGPQSGLDFMNPAQYLLGAPDHLYRMDSLSYLGSGVEGQSPFYPYNSALL